MLGLRPLAIVPTAFLRKAVLEGASYPWAQLMRAGGFCAGLVSLGFLARFVDLVPHAELAGQGGYIGFLLVGMLMADVQRTAMGTLPRVLREAQLQGTLEALLATPTPSGLVVVGLVVPALAALALRAALYLLAAHWMGVSFAQAQVGVAALALALSLAASLSLGLLGGAFTLVLRRGEPLALLIDGLSTVVGGVVYPRSILPAWLAAAGAALPLTPALDAMRAALFAGPRASAMFSSLGRLGLFLAVAAPLAVALFLWALRRARRDGSLSSY